MIVVRAWGAAGAGPEKIAADALSAELITGKRLVWIDLVDDEPDVHRQLLQDVLGLPRLAVDDALRERHPPKYEALESGWRFLLMRGFDARSTSVKFGTIQLALFWRDNVLVTRHLQPSASVAELEGAIAVGDVAFGTNAWDLVHWLLRRLLDRYLPMTLKIEARLEEIEELLLSRPSDRLLGELMEYSSQLKRLRRIGGYHEKCFLSLRAHPNGLDGIDEARLTDLLEHAERLHSLSSLLYDTTTDLTNGYLSVSSHRLNNVMRVLTVVTVLFVPLTFIAGVYGMNFTYIPELSWRWGYFTVLGVMVALVVALLMMFRHKDWL